MHATLHLIVENIHLWRGERHVLRGISFEQHPGQLVRIAGANGAGKTTLLRVLAGLSLAEEGSLRWRGDAERTNSDSEHGAFSFLGHRDGLDDSLSTRENLVFSLRLTGCQPGAAEITTALDELSLTEQVDLQARVLSAGQRRRIGLARVFLSGAGAWLLDEPYTHLDVDGRRVLNQRLERHLGAGGLVVMSTHDAALLPRPADLEVAL